MKHASTTCSGFIVQCAQQVIDGVAQLYSQKLCSRRARRVRTDASAEGEWDFKRKFSLTKDKTSLVVYLLDVDKPQSE